MVRCRESEENGSAALTRHSTISRRDMLALLAAVPAALSLRASAAAEALVSTHGLSVFGDLKYPADFKNFNYVNPQAPVGGVLSYMPGQWVLNQNHDTFNSLNTFILGGDAPPLMDMTFAALMTPALDEPDSVYGYAAESVRHDAARSYFEFELRKDVTFHDATPITAEDVVFSIDTLKKDGHPMLAATLAHVAQVKALEPDVVAVTLAKDAPRDVIFMVAGLPILSKAYYTKTLFNAATLQPPLGSGPFKVSRFEQGRFIEYERVSDWWGWQIPSRRGQLNWKKIRLDFYRDRDVGFEAFKAGQYLLRLEASSKLWVTGYTFPAVTSGQVKTASIPNGRPAGMQGFFINMRREKFMDPRVRRALALVFDFEWSNANLFYNQYKRTQSVFQNSVLMAQGKPSEAELSLLEPFRYQLPAEVFGEALVQPVSDGTGRDRKLMREALHLLSDAGVTFNKNGAFLPNGERFSIEFMESDPAFERVIMPFLKNLQALGIAASLRTVDAAQNQIRLNTYDFDITISSYGLDLTPGDGLRRVFSSKDADRPGTYNLSGIKHPAVDALLDKIAAAASRAELHVACHALDRVLRAMHFWIPQWFKGEHNVACWNIYKAPDAKPPLYSNGILETWWVDEAQAKKLGKGI